MIRDWCRYPSNFSPRTICGMVSRTPFHLFPSHRYSRLLLHSSSGDEKERICGINRGKIVDNDEYVCDIRVIFCSIYRSIDD